MRTGTADLPLHSGRAPRWLFERRTSLAREMTLAILSEEGAPGRLRRHADPVWFQAFGCVLGFDWHSSGLTTTACGALKQGLKDLSSETGIFIAGGKGRTSRKTPPEIESACWTTGQDATPLIRASRPSAKVDAAALARENPTKLVIELTRMRTVSLPRHHEIRLNEIHPDRLARILLTTYERQPEDYTALLAVPGVGAKALRALALVAELTYGEPASVRDPVSYSFAHGGKDGTPFPVDRSTYDATIESLRHAVQDTRAGLTEKSAALKRLAGVERSLIATAAS